ncbi:acyltransferase family protein [Granulicella cerasi]|uniref:Acyltransferase family protein n=1 Tax=Granulicella cerasi TaxID=741063 RepID=A0ABW1ZGD7_9BACT|nr:heparan-alpha-glucosaminide N-acetyltransferase domain-containing protein [Granulicella cerasi]
MSLAAQHEATEQVEQHIKGPRRVLSVDMLRGITIALMILVNDPGDWGHVFRQLDHSKWNGCTLTDLVFPCFLFVVGISSVFSLASRAEKAGNRGKLAHHVVSRAARLWLLAFVLSFFPRMNWTGFRFFGVLPRIAICYLLASLLLLFTRNLRVLGGIVIALLVGYWAMLRFIPVPHVGAPGDWIGFLDPVDNIAAYVDRAVVTFTQHWFYTGTLYLRTSDPEGVLSTLGSLATTLLGAMCGLMMRRLSFERMRLMLISFGVPLVLAGLAWSHWYPLNKNLWTGSYVLFTAGLFMLTLAFCSVLVDGRTERWPMWLRVSTWPWFVFGSNAIFAFAFSNAIVKILLAVRYYDANGEAHSLWSSIYTHGFSHHHSNEWTSLAFGIAFVCFCFLPNWALWHKRIFLKI